ncbi:hypothetical protein H7U32_07790 [Bifidobacterium pullorum subsp. saeculare]|uniref:Uncharacterized protein n=1 Tax=Bifidobacterium pullorum subsp. saeculare TaxID=78257 RepID=A0A939BAS9_9BIFI|nr:hypothetical protein [Bifidobacterium pullorum]MBM6700191.1 hypothetical protein [Bifidobacterium pullorum subsp. saeculare]
MFLIAVAAVAAALVTWAILRWFLPLPSRAAVQPERPVQPDRSDRRQPAAPALRLPRRLAAGVALTLPALALTIVRLAAPQAMPAPLASPWLHAILVTPVMFYCGSPIHRAGAAALRRREPDGSTMASLGAWLMYLCCLAACGVPQLFDVPCEPLFLAVDSIVVLTLAVGLLAFPRGVARPRPVGPAAAWLARAVPPLAMIVAAWTFALWAALAPSTVLPQGLVAAVNVLVVLCPCALPLPAARLGAAAVYAVVTVPVAAGVLVPFTGWLPDPTVVALVAAGVAAALLCAARRA